MKDGKLKKFITNKWTKRGALAAVLLGTGIAATAAVKKRKQRMILEDFEKNGSSNNSSFTEIIDPTSSYHTPSVPGMTQKGSIYYNRTGIAVGDKIYTFTKEGIKKLQVYFAKNKAAKDLIMKNGGYDGVIGNTFVTILNSILNSKTSSIFNITERISKTIPGIIKNAKLSSSEYSVKTV